MTLTLQDNTGLQLNLHASEGVRDEIIQEEDDEYDDSSPSTPVEHLIKPLDGVGRKKGWVCVGWYVTLGSIDSGMALILIL